MGWSFFGHFGLLAVGRFLCACCYKSVAVLYGRCCSEGKRRPEKKVAIKHLGHQAHST